MKARNIAPTYAGEGTKIFVGWDSFGSVAASGSWPSDDPDWKSLIPTDLLFISLAAFLALDVMVILGKLRQ